MIMASFVLSKLVLEILLLGTANIKIAGTTQTKEAFLNDEAL
jgi:hypothetical protein